MRAVDIFAVGTHLTARDNSVYVPSFVYRLDKALKSLEKGTRLQDRSDVFDQVGLRDIHLILADGSDEYPEASELPDLWGFLELGDTTLHILSFLVPVRGSLYLTCEVSQPEAAERQVLIAKVLAEELVRTLTATLDVVSAEYEADRSTFS